MCPLCHEGQDYVRRKKPDGTYQYAVITCQLCGGNGRIESDEPWLPEARSERHGRLSESEINRELSSVSED